MLSSWEEQPPGGLGVCRNGSVPERPRRGPTSEGQLIGLFGIGARPSSPGAQPHPLFGRAIDLAAFLPLGVCCLLPCCLLSLLSVTKTDSRHPFLLKSGVWTAPSIHTFRRRRRRRRRRRPHVSH